MRICVRPTDGDAGLNALEGLANRKGGGGEKEKMPFSFSGPQVRNATRFWHHGGILGTAGPEPAVASAREFPPGITCKQNSSWEGFRTH